MSLKPRARTPMLAVSMMIEGQSQTNLVVCRLSKSGVVAAAVIAGDGTILLRIASVNRTT